VPADELGEGVRITGGVPAQQLGVVGLRTGGGRSCQGVASKTYASAARLTGSPNRTAGQATLLVRLQ